MFLVPSLSPSPSLGVCSPKLICVCVSPSITDDDPCRHLYLRLLGLLPSVLAICDLARAVQAPCGRFGLNLPPGNVWKLLVLSVTQPSPVNVCRQLHGRFWGQKVE